MTHAEAMDALTGAGFTVEAQVDGLIDASRDGTRAVAIRRGYTRIGGERVGRWRLTTWGAVRVDIKTTVGERAAEELREAVGERTPEMEAMPA